VGHQKTNNLKIAILGTRGIPNEYGGFEQFAEYLGSGLVKRGHQVTVYNSTDHSYQKKSYKGVQIVHMNCPEKKLGALAHFIYDWRCSKDAYKKGYDLIYHSGYATAAPAIFHFSKKSNSTWVTNMDGLEWKRDKWSKLAKLLTKLMEKIAVKFSDYIISDNIGIQDYYNSKFKITSTFLPYGAEIPDEVSDKPLKEFNVYPNEYYILVSRLEPENSIEIILDGFCNSNSKTPFIVVGNHNTKYGTKLKKKYLSNKCISFVGGIYEKEKLDSLRKYAKRYFHGHTVGGTNPSLLEAMALGCSIVSHNNPFNASVLRNYCEYFTRFNDISRIIMKCEKHELKNPNRENCIAVIKENYSWEKVLDKHEQFFIKINKS
jgi:glycosyltransferase involved in cell wall biosynthesis